MRCPLYLYLQVPYRHAIHTITIADSLQSVAFSAGVDIPAIDYAKDNAADDQLIVSVFVWC